MKTFKNIYQKLLDKQVIEQAIKKAAEHKHKRHDVQRVLADLPKYVDKTYEFLKNHSYDYPKYTLVEIKDNNCRKTRYIEKPKFIYDQMIQQVLITELSKVVNKSLYTYAYGGLKGRGPIQAKKVIERWMRKDVKGTKYCLQCDLKKFYPSVDKELLLEKLKSKIKDEEFIEECEKIVRKSKQGIALGSPTSTWFGHLYLTELDHYITRLDGVTHYLRQADDLFIFGTNKKKLHKVQILIQDFLKTKLNLKMKFNWQVYRTLYVDKNGKKHGREVDGLGFLFYHDKTILRKKHIIKTTRKARKISKKKPTYYDARQLLSLLGWFRHAKVHTIFEVRIQSLVEVKKMRGLVSKQARKENEDELDENQRLFKAIIARKSKNNGLSA